MLNLKKILAEVQADLRELQTADRVRGEGTDRLHQRIEALLAKLKGWDALVAPTPNLPAE